MNIENIAYEDRYCGNCEKIGFCSQIQKLYNNLPLPIITQHKLQACAGCLNIYYCSHECNRKKNFFFVMHLMSIALKSHVNSQRKQKKGASSLGFFEMYLHSR